MQSSDPISISSPKTGSEPTPVSSEVVSPCGYCATIGSRPLFSAADTRGSRWGWRECLNCGATYLNPRPTPDQLAAAYDASYYGDSDTKFTSNPERFIDQCRRSRARRLAHGMTSGSSVLDVGCGNGGFLAALAQQGAFGLHGTEIDSKAAQRAARRPGVSLHIGELHAGIYPERSFDLITLFHVFEHLPSPRAAIELIHNLLKPNGRLCMSFPNIASRQARIHGPHWLHLDPPRHLFFLPPSKFEHAMDEAGFTIRERRFFSIEQNPFGLIQSHLNHHLPRDLLLERLKGNPHYAPEHGRLSLALQKAFATVALGPAILIDALESAWAAGATVEYTLIKRN